LIFIADPFLFKGLAWESLHARYPFDKEYAPYKDDRELNPDVLPKVLHGRLLWEDPKDSDIKLSLDEKCAAYGSQTLKQIFEAKSQSAPTAREEMARQKREDQVATAQSQKRAAT
jgi:hypothetical protein